MSVGSQWKSEASNHAGKVNSGGQKTLVACACLSPEHVADGLQSPPPQAQGTHPPDICALVLAGSSARRFFSCRAQISRPLHLTRLHGLSSPVPTCFTTSTRLQFCQTCHDSLDRRCALSPRCTYHDTFTPLHKLSSSTRPRLAISDSI